MAKSKASKQSKIVIENNQPDTEVITEPGKRRRVKVINDAGHLFPFAWTLKDVIFTKDKGKVFSCFPCGGGSTMGYKLAGFDVLGGCEIDPAMSARYKANHHPKYFFTQGVQEFKLRQRQPKNKKIDWETNDKYIPEELYHLDILDGSPPCSSFSMSGNRDDDWGKEKVFREGQASQVLDTLFFDFIDIADKLKPKVVVAENVKGLLLGKAKAYVGKIYEAFEKAGYVVQHWLFDSSKMGVPQARERVFFIAIRKDIVAPFLKQVDMFTQKPVINFSFKEKEIRFGEIFQEGTLIDKDCQIPPSHYKRWELRQKGDKSLADCDKRYRGKGSFFNSLFLYKHNVLPTLTATRFGRPVLFDEPRTLSVREFCLAGSFPLDYDFGDYKRESVDGEPGYLIGMSVPPVMTAQIATQIYNQWISKF